MTTENAVHNSLAPTFAPLKKQAYDSENVSKN